LLKKKVAIDQTDGREHGRRQYDGKPMVNGMSATVTEETQKPGGGVERVVQRAGRLAPTSSDTQPPKEAKKKVHRKGEKEEKEEATRPVGKGEQKTLLPGRRRADWMEDLENRVEKEKQTAKSKTQGIRRQKIGLMLTGEKDWPIQINQKGGENFGRQRQEG